MKVGDKVSVLDDAISGTVKKINNSVVTITTTDDFDMDYDQKELIIIDGSVSKKDLIPSDFAAIISEKENIKKNRTVRVKTKDRSLPPMEVDLHIHHLVPHTKGLSNHEMLNIQIDTAKRQLEFAMKKRIQRVVFIHGVGEGVLRAELEYLFRQYENIQVNDADFQKYGRGATEIYIFQNKKP